MTMKKARQVWMSNEELKSWDMLPKALDDICPPLYYVGSRVYDVIESTRDMGDLGVFKVFQIVSDDYQDGCGFLDVPVHTPMGKLFPSFSPWPQQIETCYLKLI
jgi:hypothetical protein